jgi:hypothetical protein
MYGVSLPYSSLSLWCYYGALANSIYPEHLPTTASLDHGLSQSSGRSGPQDIEAIVLQLEKLLGDVLDAMPGLRPVLGSLLSENRHAAHLDASRVQHRMVDER